MELKIKSLIKNNQKQIAVWVFFILMILLYFFVDPSKSAYFLKCPLKLTTGFECAGCGVQRALHELLHFRFLEAFKFNPLFVISIPILLIVVVINLSKNETLKQILKRFFGSKIFIFLVLIIVLLFSLLKNTDFYKDFILYL
ncbi:DUF2752 domain-containing protein [Epilithonimonas lactis]|uniref:DUF2752 domain-containing protein n=1 Tax=Epilithonimonas lactis TaxID=421072 RepID=UPI000689EB76|nr:Protein of unknown function [Epilithonimonas lactis]